MTHHTALITISLAAAMGAAPLWCAAQLNLPSADGYLARGRMMHSHQIFQGALDQAREAARLNAAAGITDADALYIQAMAAVCAGRSEALELLEEYAARWPESARIPMVDMASGDCLMASGNYTAAADRYARVSRSELAGSHRDDLAYRQGYCALLTGEYARARREFATLGSSRVYASAARFYTAYIAYAEGNYTDALRLFGRSARATQEPECAAPYYIAQIYYRQGEWSRAAATARPLVDNPRVPSLTPEATRILGESLWNSDASTDADRRKAVDLLWVYAASVDAPEPTALYILGVAEYDAGHYSEAVGLLQRTVADKSPMAQSAYLYMGQAYSRMGNRNGALMAFEHAYRLDFSRKIAETAFYNYAVTRMDGGNAPFANSVTILEDFLRQYPDSPYAADVENFLINGYLSANDYEAALAVLDRVTTTSPAIDSARQRVLFVLGTRDYANGRYSQALDRFNKARAIRGADASISRQCLLWSGDCHYAMEHYDAAVNDYSAYLKGLPKDDPNRAIALYDRGYARFALQQYAPALADFRQMAEGNGTDAATRADAYSRMGDCRYYANQYSDAAADYRRAYDLSPSTGDYPLYQFALMKGLLREHKVKLATIDDLIRIYPGSPLVARALLEKADTYVALDNRQAAIDTYVRLTERYPATAQGRRGLLQLAIMRLDMGERQRAIETYRRVVSTYPTSEEAALAVDDLKRIHAADGTLDQLASFLSTVEKAPAIDSSEYENLSFNAAQEAYLRTDDISRLQAYLKEYPGGRYCAQTLFYLAESATAAGQPAKAMELTGELLTHYPDSEAAEDAMLIKAESESALGRQRDAFDTYRMLEERASTPGLQYQARMGVVRNGVELREWDAVKSAAQHLSATSSGSAADRNEIAWAHATALAATGQTEEAGKLWSSVVDAGGADVYSSRSAVDLAHMLFDQGNLKKAREVADKYINSNPPQPYWLARGFIVLSDILRRQGETFEADEYLRSLRNNYPGTEADIFQMIDERLKD